MDLSPLGNPYTSNAFQPGLDLLSADRSAGIQKTSQAVQAAKALPSPTPTPATPHPIKAALSGIVNGGSAPVPVANKATLINPATGAKVVVDATPGNAEAKGYFGQGYVLMGADGKPVGNAAPSPTPAPSPAPTAAPSPEPTTPPASTTPAPGSIGDLQGQTAALKQRAFEAAYSYSPEEFANLDLKTQVQLRNERVTGLAQALGNVNAAIAQQKQEEKDAQTLAETQRKDAVDALNTYMSTGTLGSLSEQDQISLANRAGLSDSAVKAMADSIKNGTPPTLHDVNGDLYQATWNASTKKYDMKLLVAKTDTSAGAGTAKDLKGAAEMRTALVARGGDYWGTAFNTVKQMNPGATDQQVNDALGGSVQYDPSTKTFSNPTGLAAGAPSPANASNSFINSLASGNAGGVNITPPTQ